MKVKDIMTRHVASLSTEDNVEHAAELMREYNIGSIPICDGEKVIGIITDRDIVLRSVVDGENCKLQKARDIMTSNPVCGTADMEVDEAARLMSERQIRRLPIVENGKLVGIVSLGDLAVEPTIKDEAGEALSDISEPSIPSF